MNRWMLAAATLVALSAADARAGIAWTYDWTGSTDTILSDNDQSSIELTLQTPLTAVGNSDVVAANLSVHSTASDDLPDAVSHGNYFLTMHLTDVESGASTDLTFTGTVTGALAAHGAITENTFDSPTTQTLMLGAHGYQVTIGPYTGPGPVGGLPGSIGAHVEVSEHCHPAAEPGSLALALLGFGSLGLVLWRRRG